MANNGLWGALTIIGPLVLIVALIWAMRHNAGTPDEERETEEATHRMYDEQARDDGMMR